MPEIRSFRFFHYSPPEKTAADYSENEKDQFRSEFRPIARQHRIFNYVFSIMVLRHSFGSFYRSKMIGGGFLAFWRLQSYIRRCLV